MSTQPNESDTQTFSSDNLSVTLTKKPHCQIKLDITVSPLAAEAAYQKALKKVTKEVSIPGFRKGKAPLPFIMEKFGPSIKEEFTELVLQTGFNEALHLTHVQPLKEGNIKRPVVKECSRENGAHFVIEFESRLNPPTINLNEIQVPRIEPKAIAEKDEKEAFNQFLIRLATFTPVTDRPVQEGDFINLEVVLYGDFPRRIDNHRVQVNDEALPKWMAKKLVGLNVGESAEGNTERDNDNQDPTFISVPFKATVTEIFSAEMPAIDDELAKKVGLTTLPELHEKMKERLEKTAIEDAFDEQTDIIEKALLEKYPLDIPKSYLDQEKKQRLQDYLRPLLEKGLKSYADEHREAIERQIEEISVSRLRAYFLLHAIASTNHIIPTQLDIQSEFGRQSALASIGRSRLSNYETREDLHNQLYNLALEHKVKEFLLEKVSYID